MNRHVGGDAASMIAVAERAAHLCDQAFQCDLLRVGDVAGRELRALHFDRPAPGGVGLGGSSEQLIAGALAYRDAGVSELIVDVREFEPDKVVAAIERFDREVVASIAR